MSGVTGTSSVRYVEPDRTPTAPVELRAAIARAWQKTTGSDASRGVLDALTAQAMLETGRGASMVQYNFGGIKGVGPTGLSTKASTIEVENGKTKHIVDGFRAYGSLDEGAIDYVKLVRHQFGAAVARAEGGDLDGFAHELKVAHYYTANEKDYANALHALASASTEEGVSGGVSGGAPRRAVEATPPDSFARAGDIVRMLDSIRTSMARIGAPTETEE